MEYAGERGAVVAVQPFAAELAVDRLRSQHRHGFAQAAVDVLPPDGGIVRLHAAVVERIEHAFHRNITCKIPERRVAVFRLDRVSQQTVEHAVQIGAVDRCARMLELHGEPCAAEIQVSGVGRERVGVVAFLRDCERAERRVQKGQAHIQFGTGGKQDLAADLAPAFTLGHGAPPCCVGCFRRAQRPGAPQFVTGQTILRALWAAADRLRPAARTAQRSAPFRVRYRMRRQCPARTAR